MKKQSQEHERKRSDTEAKNMFAHYEEMERLQRQRENDRKSQLKKIQADNLEVAMSKKNSEIQAKVSESLKAKDLIDSGAFYNKNYEVR